MNPDKASLNEKFALIREHWRPKVAAQLNGQELKLVKFAGAFPWHHHENEDEMFLVVQGRMRMRFRDHEEIVKPGEFIIVPKGVEHLPVAEIETQVLLFEPKTTLNTGNVSNERTLPQLERI